ncbi:MAG TPA: prephenate dehydratase [bacterium]|nr:prephenate dehydratase [bacterium]HQG44872.1 prephenate dehydratase [bacterium]HQI47390.1 prephenate dehydratase [bacterium]HQJ63008.1 prephenate dehydratase [bacterium]
MASNPLAKPPSIAFQGEHDAYSELAALKFFGDDACCIPCADFEQVFAAVISGTTRFGILPVENSSTGSIHVNYDLLLQHQVAITGEVYYPIDHQLIAHPGVKLQEIRTIYSHPQALEQCRHFIASLAGVRALPAFDTAGSVRMILEDKLHDCAAIASRRAARVTGMQILSENIQDIAENITRFLIISRDPEPQPGANKTSIVFAMKNLPGALYKSLSAFALRDIDLLKIESRPWRGRPFEYIFYLDFRGTLEEQSCRNALRHLEEMTSFLKILGSYAEGDGLDPAARRGETAATAC